MNKQIVLATRNMGKLKEFRALLAPLPVEMLSLADFPALPEVEETGRTFAENASLKAVDTANRTGLLAIADDSGLEVDALGGAPGVLSARFAGEPKDDRRNNEKLLQLMADVTPGRRTARFRCTIAVVTPGGQCYLVDGTCEGEIGYEPRGINGFGYDPLFYLPAFGCTMAELAPEVKNTISHRAQAFRRAAEIICRLVGV